MKKSKQLFIIGLILLCVAGCDSNTTQNKEKVISNGSEVNIVQEQQQQEKAQMSA